jgi:16S rRNA (adenine1518-N6/adenine1519-N6)-dimethyltransferase
MMKKRPSSNNIEIKKQFGQHFLKDQTVVDTMIANVTLTNTTSVFEIGCGEGFLTKSILQTPVERLWIFEIDAEWANFVQNTYKNKRMTVFHEDFLSLDATRLEPHAPWTILANLPYQVTFPILHSFKKMRHLLTEGVIMVQEEVALNIVINSGRGYGFVSLYFQHYFEWRVLTKIPASAFFPPPKVESRLLYFKPIANPTPIPQEDDFWRFIKACFKQPRRTLRNNFGQTHYQWQRLPDDLLDMRAQQLSQEDFLKIWVMLTV